MSRRSQIDQDALLSVQLQYPSIDPMVVRTVFSGTGLAMDDGRTVSVEFQVCGSYNRYLMERAG